MVVVYKTYFSVWFGGFVVSCHDVVWCVVMVLFDSLVCYGALWCTVVCCGIV